MSATMSGSCADSKQALLIEPFAPAWQFHQSGLIDLGSAGTLTHVGTTLMSRGGASDPPGFVRLVAHPVRWRLLRELACSDRAVRELMALVDEPQSLVSYHLRQLRDGGLVTARRSSADGRDSYYALDLVRCEGQLQATGAALHPALGLVPAATAHRSTRRSRRRQRVLFLCTGNSARSQIAEALLERLSGRAIDAASAGSHPKPLHPNAVRVMRKYGIDIRGNRTKHVSEFVSQRFDVVITLCDRVREVCPEFPAHPDSVHWSMPDPAAEAASNRASFPAFERTAAELETRIRFVLPVLAQRPTKWGRSSMPRRSTHAQR
jgi:ArsR family transcriptional regulator, arsenate/arsenite/antimonite-responsive transcriptional repressor / arsenate reductase (thioredoxin)